MYLYQIPKQSKIKLDLNIQKGAMLTFHHVDGMYSYCTIDNMEKDEAYNVVHLSVMTPLKKKGKYYVLAV